MPLQQIHERIVESSYKTWQVYFLIAAGTVCIGLYLDIGFVRSILASVEGTMIGYEWLVILGIQGIIVGFAAEYIHEHGDSYAKSVSYLFDSKDRTYVVRIGGMTVVAALVAVVVPHFLEIYTEYLTIQSLGATIAAGILLIHHEIKNWDASTEWPAIVAGVLLAIVPSLL